MGPFSTPPIKKIYYSSFMTREKPNGDHRRVIIDLSWPKGHSVNSGVDKNSYLGTDFILSFPTVDHITSQVKKVGPGAHIYKIDASRAFRHVKMDPGDLDLLGLYWDDATWVDGCLPFGSRHGTQIFSRLSDAVRYVMRCHGFTVLNYVDDFLSISTPSVAEASFAFLYDLLGKLGLAVSQKKLVPPSHVAVCLGVEINTKTRTVAIPEEKMRNIVNIIQEWASRQVCTKRQLQSLLGNLLYVSKCVKPSRTFLNRMLALLRDHYDDRIIHLNVEFKRDLRWFSTFMTKYNGTSYFDHRQAQYTLELDACLSGMGGRCENLVYQVKTPPEYSNCGIVQLEMFNVLVALRVYSKLWHKQKICVKCDNKAVVQVVNNGGTKDPFLGACVRNIWLEMALHDIELHCVHIPGCKNVLADALSRWQNTQAQICLLYDTIPNPIWMPVEEQMLTLNNEI